AGGARPRPADRLRAPPAARTRTRPDRADRDAAGLASAGGARPRPPHLPDPGPRRRPPRGLADEAPPGDARPRAARGEKGADGRRAAADAGLAGDRRRADAPALQPEAATAAGDLRPLRRLHLGHLGQRLLPLRPPRP